MNILIVRLSALGDIVHAIPAAAALRRAFPAARIDWLLDARHRDIVDLVTAVDRVVTVRRSTLGGWTQVLRELRATRYDVALDFQGLVKSAVLARGSGARRVAGFSLWHLREKTARPFYTLSEDAEGGHAILKNLRLLRSVGVDDLRIEFPLAAVDSPALGTLRQSIGDSRFALINPGAAWPNKRWPPDRYGGLAATIREIGLVPIVLWGPGEEILAQAVVAGSGDAAILAPPTSVRDIVALSRAADLFVAGDTGPLHIAMAVGTPTVSIFGPTDPARNGPWSVSDLVVSRADRCGCHIDRRCHQPNWGLEDIGDDEVAASGQQPLETGTQRS